MREPRTPQGRVGLAALRDLAGALIALDYDGSLAPIVARPQDAVPEPGAVEALAVLGPKVRRLALITGRAADVVVELGGLQHVPHMVVLGQYGVQRWEAGRLEQEPPLPGLARARAELATLIAQEPGLSVEDKGRSLVVHGRQADEQALARVQPRVLAVSTAAGLELHPGRRVLELRPPGHDKGRALLTLAVGCTAVLYAGDDVGDLPAYDAVDRLRREGTPGLLVCSDSDEAPPELRTRADLVVPGPAGVVALLRELAQA